MINFNTVRSVLIKLLFCCAMALAPLVIVAAEDPIVMTEVKGDYHEVANNIRMAIIGKGINIAHELPASEMLNRTGSAYGYAANTYSNARIFEFCSARLSQKLSRQSSDNIILCPFTISVYSLVSKPDIVHITYRKPVGRPGSEAIVEEVIELISSIVEDAVW